MLKKGKIYVFGDYFYNNVILYEKEEYDYNIKINRREDGKEINVILDVIYFKFFVLKVIVGIFLVWVGYKNYND